MSRYGLTRNDVLTLAEAARFIRVSEKTLGAMAREKRIPSQKVGREWRFFRHALEDWLQGHDRHRFVAEPIPPYRQGVLFEDYTPEKEDHGKARFSDTAFMNNRREPLHRWVPWIAGFSAAFVEGVFNEVVSTPPREVTVLDPFAGVGTTLVEGLKRGYNVIGFEINPYAAMVCRVKLQAACCNATSLLSAVKRFEDFMRAKAWTRGEDPKSIPPAIFKTRRPFFSPAVERQVLYVQDFINAMDQGLFQDLFKVALGSVMVSFSNYSYEPSLSTRSAAGKSDVLDANVGRIVADKLWEMAADISFLQRHLARFNYQPAADVYGQSHLVASGAIPRARVNVLVTSPPYLNNYHYIRNTRPQLYWLGLVHSPEHLRKIEVESFGQFWQTVRGGPTIDLTVRIPELSRVLDAIRGRNPEKGVYGGRGWANYAASYFNDCDRFCEITRRIMKPGGRLVVVIGNNILQGVEVKTDEFFAQIAERHGFGVVGLHRVRRKRTGSSIINSSVRAGTTRNRTELHETAVELTAPG